MGEPLDLAAIRRRAQARREVRGISLDSEDDIDDLLDAAGRQREALEEVQRCPRCESCREMVGAILALTRDEKG